MYIDRRRFHFKILLPILMVDDPRWLLEIIANLASSLFLTLLCVLAVGQHHYRPENFIINLAEDAYRTLPLLTASCILHIAHGQRRHAPLLSADFHSLKYEWVSVFLHIYTYIEIYALVPGILHSVYRCVHIWVYIATVCASELYSNWIFARDFRSLNPTAEAAAAAAAGEAEAEAEPGYRRRKRGP